jgi:hypothetical protein
MSQESAPHSDDGKQPGARSRTMDALFFIGLLALWLILQIWVLPKSGIST